MKTLSKICDAADWFDPEFKNVISNELCEPPRFHRKQWEFALIFLSLQKLGMLDEGKIGLSVGGGNERVLYSIAKHIKKLIVTDLYDSDTSWDCARTNDPDEFIKANKPFPLDDSKLQALRMDMRYLEFEDNTFDFCYSSCAIEHIGDYNDFLQHFNEIYRVLKEDGVYIFTTELQFENETIKDPNNYIFSADYLSTLLSESKLTPVYDVDAGLSQHQSNFPFPPNIKNIGYTDKDTIVESIFDMFPHLILLRGKVPFTSVGFILRKKSVEKSPSQIQFDHFDETKFFLLQGRNDYAKLISEKEIFISPFSMLPDGLSASFLDHAQYFSGHKKENQISDTVFHSDYFWFANGKREINIRLKTESVNLKEKNIIEVRIHRYKTLNSALVENIFSQKIELKNFTEINESIIIETGEEYNYAILCKVVSGSADYSLIEIKSKTIVTQHTDDELIKHLINMEGY